ncbi:MAG TPA: hypothetical protein VMM56_07155 [Planctomycetaceae bacterium]|nr:hypothetical protein [Planctomycetaceae bacterium]
MQHPEFGELEYDEECEGYAFERKFGFLSRFVESGREVEYLDDSAHELESKLKDLFDKTPEEIEREGIPDEFKQTPLAFILPNMTLFDQLNREIEHLASEIDEEDLGFDDDDLDDFDDDDERIRNSEGIFQITVRTNESSQPPSEVQLATLEKFFRNEETIGQKISEAIFRYYRELQADEPEFFDIKVDAPDDQVGVIFFSELTVNETEIDGEAVLGFHFDAEWEPEHGLGVSVHKGEILDVGGWETAEDGPGGDGTVWYKLCSRAQQKQIDRVCQVMQARWEAEVREQQKDPHFQLVTAFQAGDMDRVRQLHSDGVDLNRSDDRHSPLLYIALHQEIDPETDPGERIEQLLEMGADPSVKVGGKTILKHAEELLKNLEFSQKFLNSNASRQMFQLIQTQLGPDQIGRPDPATVVNQQVQRLEKLIRLLKETIERR